MKFKKLISKFLFFSVLSSGILFAQTYDDLLPPEDIPEENIQELENQNQNNFDEANNINPLLQERFTIAHTAGLSTLNPHLSSFSSENQILVNIYEGLFSYDPVNLEPRYAIAKEYKISRDKKRWTFILRDDAKFHDGSKINANNVKNSWMRLLKTPGAPYSSLLDIVKGASEFRTGTGTEEEVGIYVLADNMLSIHLKSPAAYLPRLLCMPAFAVLSDKKGLFSGAYFMAEVNPTEIVILKNNNYYDANKVHIKQVHYLLNDNADENAYLYNIGESDWVSGAVNLDRVINKSSQQLTAEYGTEFFFFKLYNEDSTLKTQDYNIWNKKEFRSALLEAVPWDSLREKTFVPASTLVYPLNGYPQVQGYSYTDPIESNNLFNAARQQYNIPSDKELSITICVSEVRAPEANKLKNAWESLGIKVNIIPVKTEEYLTRLESISADIFIYSWVGDFTDPLAFLELFRADSTLNVSHWQNAEFEEYLNQANIYNDENHTKYLSKAEQVLLDDAMVMPLQHPVTLNVINLNEVGGWYANSFDIHPMKFIFKKEVKRTFPGLVLFTK